MKYQIGQDGIPTAPPIPASASERQPAGSGPQGAESPEFGNGSDRRPIGAVADNTRESDSVVPDSHVRGDDDARDDKNRPKCCGCEVTEQTVNLVFFIWLILFLFLIVYVQSKEMRNAIPIPLISFVALISLVVLIPLIAFVALISLVHR